MFSFDSLKTIFYLKDKSLLIYSDKLSDGFIKWDFPPRLVENLEIQDQTAFTDQLTAWISGAKLGKQKALIVLSEEVLFSKTLSSDDRNTASSVESFLNEIPFDSEKVAKIYFSADSGIVLAATNKELYQTVIGALEKLGWEIAAVVPSLIWGQLGETLDPPRILQKPDLLKSNNFLTPPDFNNLLAQTETKEEAAGEKIAQIEAKKGSTSKIIWWVTLVITLILAGILGVTLRENFLKSSAKKTAAPAAVFSPTPFFTVTPTPLIEVSKEDLKVEVLNGTGIPGQAVGVKELLQKLGFVKFEVGNTEEKVTEAVVIFSNRVSQDIQDEVLEELQKTFTKVWTRTGEIEADIQVTTGKYLQKE